MTPVYLGPTPAKENDGPVANVSVVLSIVDSWLTSANLILNTVYVENCYKLYFLFVLSRINTAYLGSISRANITF